MRFDINLASQPYQDVQRFLLRWGLATSIVTLATLALVYTAATTLVSWRTTEKRVHYLQQQIAERNRQKADAESFLDRAENRDTRDRSEFLNGLIARKAFSWTEVFTDLERIMPPRLHVISIQPAVNNDNELELHLVVGGTSRDGAIELVRRLETSPHFTRAEINSESLKSEQNQAEGWNYALSAVYIPSFARTRQAAAPPASDSDKEPAGQDMASAVAEEVRNGRH